MSHENIMRLWSDCSVNGVERPRLNITIKTASYTITPDDFGKVFTTRGATSAVTFTLPAAATANKGHWVLFVNIANYDMIVAGATNGLVTFNDAAANNVGLTVANERIGGAFISISDGTSWLTLPITQETQTIALDTSTSSSPSSSVSSSPSSSISSSPSSSPSSSVSSSPS
jgi:hypothetical protein